MACFGQMIHRLAIQLRQHGALANPRWLGRLIQVSALLAASVQAHSAPGVAAIVDEDDGGVHMLRLYQGLVLREGPVWRFVCSQTYSGVGQDLAASLPGGGAVVALPNGIAIMKRDGSVEPHPDPESQQGIVTAFARGPGNLYALRMRPRLRVSDVIEITDSTVRVVWTDTRFWSDIAVGDSSLALVRFEQDGIEELRLSSAGEVVSQQMGQLVDPLEVSVRVIGDVPYYTAKLENSTLLGRIDQGTWVEVLTAGNTVAGPVALADGTVLVALDGVLSTLASDVASPLMDTDFVIGLSQLDGHPYACTRTGLRELSGAGLGAQLFDLSELRGPDECLVPEASQNDCDVEWQHLQVELLGANIPLATGDTAQKECATAAVAGQGSVMMAAAAGMGGMTAPGATDTLAAAGGATALAGSAPVPTAAAPSSASSNTAEASDLQPATPPASGCACSMTSRAQRGAAGGGLALLFAGWLLIRMRARRSGV